MSVGVFGYGHESEHRQLVVQAISHVASMLEGVELILVGGPGPRSSQGLAWEEAARAAGCPYHFTGVLPPEELSRALSGLGVFVFFDDSGPTSRKTTLAAALAHGVPTIALDGPHRWAEITDSGAIQLVAPEGPSLSEGLRSLLTDPVRRSKLGKAGRRFYDGKMAPEVVAAQVAEGITAALTNPRVSSATFPTYLQAPDQPQRLRTNGTTNAPLSRRGACGLPSGAWCRSVTPAGGAVAKLGAVWKRRSSSTWH